MRAKVLVPKFTFHHVDDFPLADVDGNETMMLFWSAKENKQIGQKDEELPEGGWLILCAKTDDNAWEVVWEYDTTGKNWGKWSEVTIAIDSEPYGIAEIDDVDEFITDVCGRFISEDPGDGYRYDRITEERRVVVDLEQLGYFDIED